MRKKHLIRGRVESASPNDINEIIPIEKEGSPNPWKRSFFERELTNKFSYFKIYRSYDNDEIEGFLIFRKIEDVIEITNISVREKSRKKGIASAMMSHMTEIAKREHVTNIFLEVRESNIKAVRFYGKFDFEKVGVRKNYYKSPIEDALVFRLKI